MAQHIYTKETQDLKTGEIVKREIFRKQVANKEQFVRAYIQDIGALAKCSGAEQSFVLCALQYLDYATNEFILNSERRKSICECGNMKMNTANSAITRLVKKGILIRKSESTYILNPKIFFYGKDLDRAKTIEATMVYEIGPQNPMSRGRPFKKRMQIIQELEHNK